MEGKENEKKVLLFTHETNRKYNLTSIENIHWKRANNCNSALTQSIVIKYI